MCYSNPDIFREALSLVRRQPEEWGTELSTLAVAQRIVEDWLVLCPATQWRDPPSAQDCIDRLHRQAARALPPLAAEPFLHTVLGYFGLSSTEGGAAYSSEPLRYMLECLYYSSTGLPKRHGKREPQLLEEA